MVSKVLVELILIGIAITAAVFVWSYFQSNSNNFSMNSHITIDNVRLIKASNITYVSVGVRNSGTTDITGLHAQLKIPINDTVTNVNITLPSTKLLPGQELDGGSYVNTTVLLGNSYIIEVVGKASNGSDILVDASVVASQ